MAKKQKSLTSAEPHAGSDSIWWGINKNMANLLGALLLGAIAALLVIGQLQIDSDCNISSWDRMELETFLDSI